ncbi:MAG: hypothetical protein V1843_02965 [bacterium]
MPLNDQTTIMITALIVGLILGLLLFYYVSKKIQQWILQWRYKRGRKGEEGARKLLQRNGYRILTEQEEVVYTLLVDGRKRTQKIILDYRVEKNKKVYVAEVKTGNCATIDNAGTRRQLLEYAYVTGTTRVLLIDMEKSKIRLIDFKP